MIFSLNNFYNAGSINNFLYTLSKTHPDFFKGDISFQEVKGSFPFTSWNGGPNNSFGNARYYDFLKARERNFMNLRLDFSNIFLDEQDFYSRKENLILNLFRETQVVIEVANLALYEFLYKSYPEYSYVFSKKADLIAPFTPDLLNRIVEENKFSLIGLPDRVIKNWNFLSRLNSPNKFEITVNPQCADCLDYSSCQMQENNSQLEFSGRTNAFCEKRSSILNAKSGLSIDDLSEYLNRGFFHFGLDDISPCDYERNSNAINHYLLKYFIKQDILIEVIAQWNTYQKEGEIIG